MAVQKMVHLTQKVKKKSILRGPFDKTSPYAILQVKLVLELDRYSLRKTVFPYYAQVLGTPQFFVPNPISEHLMSVRLSVSTVKDTDEPVFVKLGFDIMLLTTTQSGHLFDVV